MTIEIQDNIPIPGNAGNRSINSETANKLKPGQSFIWQSEGFVPDEILLNRARGIITRIAGKKFTARIVKEGDPPQTVVRVWRLPDAVVPPAPPVPPNG